MVRRFLCILGLAVAVTGSAPASDEAIQYSAIPGVREFSGQLIARPVQQAAWLSKGLSADEAVARVAAAREAMGEYELREYVWQTDHYVFHVPAGKTENAVANELMATGHFQYVEPNWTVYPLECPDDSRFNQQWHHDSNRMMSCEGWDIHTGDPSTSVGICDTGIRTTHEDFQLHRLEGYNAVDRQWESQGGGINDLHGHGTATTGCAAANGDNGVGVAGVGWNLSHRMLRVSNSSGGGSSLAVLQHAAMTAVESGDKVASVSYSGVDANSNLTTATYVKSIGGLMIWAAGNEGRNLTLGNRDADDLIVTGATDSSDTIASFSNYGIFVDLVAPGVDVYTTNAGSNSSYGGASGTSFSCPLTAGLAGLVFSAAPALSPDEVEAFIKEACDDLGANGVDNTYGYGRINVLNSLAGISIPLEFNYPDGIPELLNPNGGTTVRVEVLAVEDQPQPGTGRVYYDDGGGYVDVPMQVVSDNVYDAVFPAFYCGAEVSFYFSAETTGGEVVTDPRSAPGSAYSALAIIGIIVNFADDFETDQGWSVVNENLDTGAWVRAVPSEGGDRGDPSTDYDGSGRCYVTGNTGDEDVDGGPTRLISPQLDLSGGADYVLRYARWFYNDDNDIDRLLVEISNDDGGSWVTVENVSDSGSWVVKDFSVADFITPTAQVRVRFSATDNPNDSVTEAAVDAFEILVYDCGEECPGDLDGDGTTGQPDLGILLGDWGCTGGDCVGDIDGDGQTGQPDLGILLGDWNCGTGP